MTEQRYQVPHRQQYRQCQEQNSHRLEKKLTSFLSPTERAGKAELLKAITKKYITRQRAANERAASDRMGEARPKAEPAFSEDVPMPQPMEVPAGALRFAPAARAM